MNHLFSDLPRNEAIINTLYHQRGVLGLNEFLGRVTDRDGITGKLDDFMLPTLAYLLPLLRRGEIKVRVRDLDQRYPKDVKEMKAMHVPEMNKIYDFRKNVVDYTKDNAEACIVRIRKSWKEVQGNREKEDDFVEWGIRITLPGNEFW